MFEDTKCDEVNAELVSLGGVQDELGPVVSLQFTLWSVVTYFLGACI